MAREPDVQEWDKRKLLIAIFLLLILIILGGFGLFRHLNKNVDVAGLSTQKDVSEIKKPALDLKNNVAGNIESIKKEVNGINVAEVASSSPQIQKVLRDIQGIKDLPANQAKDACLKICGNL